jgi:hypothetical protein
MCGVRMTVAHDLGKLATHPLGRNLSSDQMQAIWGKEAKRKGQAVGGIAGSPPLAQNRFGAGRLHGHRASGGAKAFFNTDARGYPPMNADRRFHHPA